MMIQAIHRNAIRLNNLFGDLLTLSKIEANDGVLFQWKICAAGNRSRMCR